MSNDTIKTNLQHIIRVATKLQSGVRNRSLSPADVSPSLNDIRSIAHDTARLPGAGSNEQALAAEAAKLPIATSAFDALGGFDGVDRALQRIVDLATKALGARP